MVLKKGQVFTNKPFNFLKLNFNLAESRKGIFRSLKKDILH